MSKKQNLQNLENFIPEKTGDEESDNELEYVANPLKKQPKQQIPLLDVSPPVVKKEKQKRNITEEHKQVLRERLKVAHQRKQELAEERRKQKDVIEAEYNLKKEEKILQEAERLRRVREKDLKKIEVAAPNKKEKKKPVFVYYDEDESEQSEEEVIIKQKKKPQPKPVQQQPVYHQQPVQQPVYQQPPPFQIKFC